jgi:hypothetical protein
MGSLIIVKVKRALTIATVFTLDVNGSSVPPILLMDPKVFLFARQCAKTATMPKQSSAVP